MLPKISHLSNFNCLILLLFLNIIHHSKSEPTTNGYTCTINSTTTNYPCQTYVLYRAKSPNFLDLASIGDIFNVSRLTISKPSNISNPSSSLLPNQPLFIPISCGCHPVQNQTLKSISFANMTYTFKPNDNFYYVSTEIYGYLTTYQSTEIVNPNLDVHNLPVGGEYIFPIFCKCPNNTQLRNNVSFLVSYVFQPDDNLSSIASLFGVTRQSIVDVNGDNPKVFDTIFVPISKLVKLNQPIQPPGAPNNQTNSGSNQTIVVHSKSNHKGAAVGLGVGMGVSILLLVLVSGVSIYREIDYRKKSKERDFEVINRQENARKGSERRVLNQLEQNLLLADVSDTLDKYKIYEIDELRKATNGFDEKSVIYGSVYQGCINGKFYAIKKDGMECL